MKKYILLLIAILTFGVQKLEAQTISLDNTNWFSNGPYTAYVSSLALAPSNTDVLYAGTYAAGVYKTINGGNTWSLCATDNLPVYTDSLNNSPTLPCWWFGKYYPIQAIAVHPQNENNLWIAPRKRGLYKSTDGGQSWQKANESLPNALTVKLIHINPENPDDILLGTSGYNSADPPQNGGLYRSIDGGNTWFLVEEVPNGDSYTISDITRAQNNNNHILISISSAGEPGFSWGLMESYDNGITWRELSTNIWDFHNVSINVENNQNLWSSVYTGYQAHWLMCSNDGGFNWNLYEGFDDPYKWVTGLFTDTDFNMYIKRRSAEPDYSFDMLKSTDNGASWTGMDKLMGKTYLGIGIFKNNVQANHANAKHIYFSNCYGIYYSENGGQNTQVRNKNLRNAYIMDLEARPKNKDIVYAAGLQGLWKSTDAGQHWENIIREKIKVVKCDPQHPDTLYFGGRDLWRSFDGGQTYQKIATPLYSTLTSIAIHPQKTNIVYYKIDFNGSAIIYKSLDCGSTWELVFSCYVDDAYREMIIDPNHPDTLYMGIYRSLNGGETWENTFDKKILAVHPANSNILYATKGNYIYNTVEVSYDWGDTFETLSTYNNGPFPGGNIYCFRFDTDNPDYLFYSTRNTNIYYSLNAGDSWQQLSGTYNRRVMDIIPYVNDNKFYLATHGGGVWVYDTTYTSAIEEYPIMNKHKVLNVSPNPFSNKLTINFSITAPSNTNISVYTLNGILLTTLTDEYTTTGKHTIIWNGKDKYGKEVPTGLYFVRLTTNKQIYTSKVVFVK